MRGPVRLVLLALRLGIKWPIQSFLSLVAVILEEGIRGQVSATWRASEAQKLAGAIPGARPSGPTCKALFCPPPWVLPGIGSYFTASQAPPANSPPTYHTDEVDAEEDLASGLEGTAAGFLTVELPSTTGQHKKAADDGHCA